MGQEKQQAKLCVDHGLSVTARHSVQGWHRVWSRGWLVIEATLRSEASQEIQQSKRICQQGSYEHRTLRADPRNFRLSRWRNMCVWNLSALSAPGSQFQERFADVWEESGAIHNIEPQATELGCSRLKVQALKEQRALWKLWVSSVWCTRPRLQQHSKSRSGAETWNRRRLRPGSLKYKYLLERK